MIMPVYDPSRVAAIIIQHFYKNGKKGARTMPFGDLPMGERTDLLTDLQCVSDELPILAHFQSRNDWVILTTCRLVVRQSSAMVTILWSDFVDFEVDLDPERCTFDPKNRLNTLTVLGKGGLNVKISTDPGPPFFAFWNALIMAKKMAPEEDRRRASSLKN